MQVSGYSSHNSSESASNLSLSFFKSDERVEIELNTLIVSLK